MPRISIIIPVYNVEHDIRKCLDSIVAQSFCDFECLLIDDGSTDNSRLICDEYTEKDSRFKVFHQPNSGVSVARNLGLNHAKGEYVAFIDSDDYVSDNYLSVINECNKDIIFLENKYVYRDGTIFDYYHLGKHTIDDRKELLKFISDNIVHPIMKVVWAKLIRRSVIGDTRFNVKQTIGEDTLFMYDILRNCHSIATYTGYTYYWLHDGGDYVNKYSQSPAKSAEYASNIYQSYRRLGFVSMEMELFVVNMFYMLCHNKDNYSYLKPWFKNKDVKKMNNYLLKVCSEKLSEEYKLYTRPILIQYFLRVKHSIGGFLRSHNLR